MQHFPIFLATEGRRIVLSGGGDAALAKLRLLMKTQADLTVFSADPAPEIKSWAASGRLTLIQRAFAPGDTQGAVLFYAADEDPTEDARTAALAKAEGAMVNIVDNLGDSQFITPAIVDRDPVTIAIGTEGAAPVLARAIKTDLEDRLPVTLGTLARIGKAFRKMAERLPMGRRRREFWSDFYFNAGPRAIAQGGDTAVRKTLDTLLRRHLGTPEREGHVAFVGAGPGDPELLTLKARKAIDQADVVIHDHLVAPEVLELARREAVILDAGKMGSGSSLSQDEMNALILRHAAAGAQIVFLKVGNPTVSGILIKQVDAIQAADIGWHIVPGISAGPTAVANHNWHTQPTDQAANRLAFYGLTPRASLPNHFDTAKQEIA